MKIALLEDDKSYHQVMVKMLEELNLFDVQVFSTIKEIEQYKGILNIDILIADYFLGKGSTVADLLKSNLLSKKTKVIVITNYFEGSVYEELSEIRKVFFLKKGFQILELKNAIDTLLKPNGNKENIQLFEGRFFVKVGATLKPIDLDKVAYLEVEDKYVNVRLVDKKSYAIRSTLTDLEYKLPKEFTRVHAAYIVNTNHIEGISLNSKTVVISDTEIPFSRTYKSELFSKLSIA